MMFAEGVVRAGRGEAQSWGRRVGVGAEDATEPLAPSMGNGTSRGARHHG